MKPGFSFDTAGLRSAGRHSRVYVVSTDLRGTIAALNAAARLTNGLGLTLRLLLPRVVPYPLPIERPPVERNFIEPALANAVDAIRTEVLIDIVLCRSRAEALRSAVPGGAIVVLGTTSLRERLRQRLAVRVLRKARATVILLD